jgi:putative tryptophan/tyrosine transport system substrate-binding protein
LLDAKVELIVSTGGPPTVAAVKSVSPTIPVVFVTSDPVAEGIVASLPRPGGNFTGIAILATNLDPKRMEMAKEAFPTATNIAVLQNPTFPSADAQAKAISAAAAKLGLNAPIILARNADELGHAFAEIDKVKPDFLFVATDAIFYQEMAKIIAFAAARRLPAIYQQRQFVDAGGLIAYGANLVEAQRQMAPYVDKILRGAKPADLPVELSRAFDLSVNLKTAKALGLTIPPTLLVSADEVIE